MGGLERGERNLTLRSLERIAEQMGVEVEELMRCGVMCWPVVNGPTHHERTT